MAKSLAKEILGYIYRKGSVLRSSIYQKFSNHTRKAINRAIRELVDSYKIEYDQSADRYRLFIPIEWFGKDWVRFPEYNTGYYKKITERYAS